MTAAEYHSLGMALTPGTPGRRIAERLLAALEERERLLGERREAAIQARVDGCNAIPSSYSCGESDTPGACWDCYQFEKDQRRSAEERLAQDADDASLGALVRRIDTHPMHETAWVRLGFKDEVGHSRQLAFNHAGFNYLSRHLDSLLPKEPEVVTGPSGMEFRVVDGELQEFVRTRDALPGRWMPCVWVRPVDAPVVAKLMEAK